MLCLPNPDSHMLGLSMKLCFVSHLSCDRSCMLYTSMLCLEKVRPVSLKVYNSFRYKLKSVMVCMAVDGGDSTGNPVFLLLFLSAL